MEKQELQTIVFGVLFLVSVIIKLTDIVIILTCCKRKIKQRTRFYIIGSISSADLILTIAVDVILSSVSIHGKVKTELLLCIPQIVAAASYLASIAFILFLSTERFIAVRFCLRYHEIVTERRVVFSIGVCCFFSLLMPTLLRIAVDDRFKYILHLEIAATIFRVMVVVFLVIISIYTNIVRDRHAKNIKTRKIHFGILQEDVDTFNKLRRSIKDTFKSNIATTITLLIQTIFELLRAFPETGKLMSVNIAALIILFLLKISSLLAIVFTQEMLRKELKKVFCFWKRSIRPGITRELTCARQTVESNTFRIVGRTNRKNI